MRAFLIVVAACGAASVPEPAPTATALVSAPRRSSQAPRERIDPVAALARPRVESGWVVPGPAQLVLGGTSLQPLDDRPVEVDLLEERGSEVRVGVRLDHARFALWIGRSHLLGVIAREQRISSTPQQDTGSETAPSVTLRAGARVRRLAHKGEHTQIRYLGVLEVEGWVPDAAVSDRGPAGRPPGRRFGGRKSMLVQTGATIRTEQRGASRALAVAHASMFVDNTEVLDEGWHRVSYSDADVTVSGFLSKRDPPSRTHPPREAEPSAPLSTNITVPADTCLYAGDETIGFVVGDRAALLEQSPRVGWFTLTLDTPWGAVPFEAKGPAETALVQCPSSTP